MADFSTERDRYATSESALAELEHISSQLHSMGAFIGSITLLHIGVLSVSVLMVSGLLPLEYRVKQIIALMFIFLDMLTVANFFIILFRHDRLAQKGQVIYQEISDEIEWNPDKRIGHDINLRFRITLREFVFSTTFPFYRAGQNGAIVYLVINLLLSAALWIVSISALSKVYPY